MNQLQTTGLEGGGGGEEKAKKKVKTKIAWVEPLEI